MFLRVTFVYTTYQYVANGMYSDSHSELAHRGTHPSEP